MTICSNLKTKNTFACSKANFSGQIAPDMRLKTNTIDLLAMHTVLVSYQN